MFAVKRIAFVKFAGLSAGGTERWLQVMAANLPRDEFEVDFYYCAAAPYIGSDYRHPDTDPDRLLFMRESGVRLIEFKVGAKDVTRPTHNWINTDFWQVFDESRCDLVQTAKAGHKEYPYYLMKKPVVEFVALSAGVDRSHNIAWSIHLSEWQRRAWSEARGNLARSSVIPIPANHPVSSLNLRDELGIPAGALVAGFHQRPDDHIASPIPLNAFNRLRRNDAWFVIMGGGEIYRRQAADLGLKHVRFITASANPERLSMFLNTLDVFAHGRRDGETFGTVFAEAMMHSRPCLSHRTGIADAQPETMGPGGLFANDEDEYVQFLSDLLANADWRIALGRKGYEHAAQHYSIQGCVSQLTSLYRQLLADPAVPACSWKRPWRYAISDLVSRIKPAIRSLLLRRSKPLLMMYWRGWYRGAFSRNLSKAASKSIASVNRYPQASEK
jgi:glycosyltransferase involved in cell wall biosynthesis